MAYAKRIVRRVLVEVLESKEATFDERIKAVRLLTKHWGSAKTGNSRCGQTAKKIAPKDRLADILSDVT
jgi:hypothetical protein